jgi:drug/metabolite transporter, DME family
MHRQTRRACRRQDRWRMGPQVTTVIAPGRRDATLLVALAASMWGLDGLLRKPLATQLDAGTVVLWEHVIVLLVLAPRLPSALRAFRRCRWHDRAALAAIGVGASAVATALFTQAFALSARSE